MENPSYIALSQQVALRRQMDVIANNLANVSTPGFKAERIVFSEYLVNPPRTGTGAGSGRMSFVREIGMLRDTTEGAFIQTGNALDLAIHGRGYFVVETPDGLRYTRQSSFQLDPDGRIVTSQGFPLLDENNRPLIVPPESGPIEVTPQGVVGTSEGEIGRIRLVTFTDEQTMRKIGGGLYESDEEPMDADGTAEIHQGAVEGSNVQAILEVTNMIEIMRRYQSAQKILDTEHELERRAIEKLARAV